MKRMPNRWSADAVLWIVLFLLPLLLLLLMPLRGQLNETEEENRSLQKFPQLTAEGLLSGDFQDDLEQAVSDQALLSGAIKALVQDGRNSAYRLARNALYLVNPSLRTHYEPISEGYYHYNGDAARIVERPTEDEGDAARLSAFAAPYNALTGVKRYLYFIENARVIDFDNAQTCGRVYHQVRAALKTDGADVFAVRDYADYCARFYQTDHHWNQSGAYEGYCAIVRMLLGEGEAPVPIDETIELEQVFNGAYARQTHELCATERFAVSSYTLPKHTVLINGKRGTYGHMSAYLRGRAPNDALRNHYAYCFGGDYALIEYQFNAPDKGNLLLVASSYSNPINALLASHYNKTFVVDTRYYQAYAGAPFDPAAFVRDNDIDTVLLLGDVNMFMKNEQAEEAAK